MLLDHPAPRLLLIESHASLRKDLSAALERAGFQVDAFADALDAEAEAALAARPMLQMVDPNAEGAEAWLATAAADKDRRRPTLILANAGLGQADANAWLQQGFSTLYKPFSLSILEQRIVEILGRRPPRTPAAVDPMLVTEEPDLLATFGRARKWASRSFSICIEGEIGTGRRALARAIHHWGSASLRPCAVLERSSVESSAPAQVGGLIEDTLGKARDGSMILIEPDEWPAHAGEALITGLRRVQGESGPRCLVITKQPLPQSVREGRLAVELQYRLDAAQLRMPPIRERTRDQLALCTATGRRVARELGLETPLIRQDMVEFLAAEGFPGNRLGLESRLRSALVRAGEQGDLLAALRGESADAAVGLPARGAESLNLKELERETIIRALAHWDGNRTRASETLGISVRTLRNKIREYALR